VSVTKTKTLDCSWLQQKPTEVELGVDIDYYRLFYALKQRYTTCYLFESLGSPKHRDRYVTLGFDPCLTFRAEADRLTIAGRALLQTTGTTGPEVTIAGINPYVYLQQQVPLQYLAKTHQGGLIGYFCYEAVNYFEPAVQLAGHPNFANFQLGLYADGLIFDTETDTLTYYTYTQDRSDEVRELLATLPAVQVPSKLTAAKFLGHSETKESYTKAVQNTLEEIRAGNTFQCEVGFKSFYELQGEKMAVYDTLRRVNPSPYMYYVQFDEIEVMGASPELLIASTNRRVLTTPTAGTRPRGSDGIEDKALGRELLGDAKEIAEHNMLVDLHRNDLGRVCEVDSVQVSELMYLMRFSHVQHIVSDVTGFLSRDKTAYDLLAAILPGGVVSGAPKIETIKIIDRNEQLSRGPYGGAVGRFSFNGDASFCLPLRSLFCRGDHCFAQTSSGVVYDSTVEQEYEEVLAKLAAMEQTIRQVAMEGENANA
jgi:anthranilate synthase component I